MLRSRVFRRVAFAPLGAREILGVVRRYHPLYSGVDE